MNKELKQSFIRRFIYSFFPAFIIILLPLIFFFPAALGQTIIVAGDFTGSDLLDLNYPFKVALSEAIRARQLPLWTPFLSNGFPLLAEGQMGAFYPPNLIFALLTLPAGRQAPHLALNYSLILVFILAGLFTYLYCRSLKLGQFASLAAGIIFMFSAFFVVRIKHLNLIAVACWVPFIFWTTRKFFQTRKFLFPFLTGLALALQFLAGHPQMAFFSLFIFAIYFFFELGLGIKKHGFAQIFPQALLALLMIAFLTAGLSAIQTLPTFELAQHTEKTEYTLVTATAYPFHPKNLITFISPYYFGNPALGSYKENIRVSGIFWENCSYIGLLPILLFSWVLFRTLKSFKKKQANPHFLFFIILCLFCLALMMGRYTPLFGFLWHNLPGFAFFRFPNRFNLFLIFSLSLLAGAGAQLLVKKLNQVHLMRKSTPTTPGGGKFTWPLDQQKTQILILGFIVADLFVFGKNYIGNLDASSWLKKPESVEFLQQENQNELYRILSVTQYADSPYQLLGWKKDPEPLIKIREAIPPDANLVFHLPTLSDRSWFEGGYNFKRRNHLERWLLNEATDQIAIGKVLGLFNVKYILSFAPVGGFEMELKKEIDLGEFFMEKIRIFENKQSMERIYYVPEAEVVESETALFSKIQAEAFYPSRTVLLEKPPQNSSYKLTTTIDDFNQRNPIKIEKYGSQEIILKTDFQDPGFLVISDTYYPGWKATVDDQPQEILPANYLARALEMTPGEHTVRMFYDPLSFKIGVTIFGLTWSSLVGLGVARGLKKLSRKGLKLRLRRK
jgi:hypothetical protein